MALKLRRQVEMFTNGNPITAELELQPDSLGRGADSFKRVLGSAYPKPPLVRLISGPAMIDKSNIPRFEH